MKHSKSYIVYICSMALALLDAIYLTFHHYKIHILRPAASSFCTFNSYVDCDAVALSEYSELFGMPVASIGIFAYSFVLLFQLFGGKGRRLHSVLIYWVSLSMAAFSLYEFYAAIFWVKSLCIMCCFLYILVFTMIIANKINLKASHKELFSEAVEGLKNLKPLAKVGTPVFIVALILGISLDQGFQSHFRSIEAADEGKQLIKRSEALFEQYNSAKQTFLSLENVACKGDASASKVVITEFSDLECPFCSKMATFLNKVQSESPDKVAVCFKHFPLDNGCNPLVQKEFHKNACNLAQLTECARRQDVFWKVHDHIFNSPKGTDFDAEKIAEMFQLDGKKLAACLNEPLADNIKRDISEGIKVDVKFTPALFINGKFISEFAETTEDIKLLIQKLISK